MTNQEILTKAINQAIEGGWKATFKFGMLLVEVNGNSYQFKVEHDTTQPFIIFNHDFAKSFFGEKRLVKGKWFIGYDWQFHLQKMVIEPDPIRYLERFL